MTIPDPGTGPVIPAIPPERASRAIGRRAMLGGVAGGVLLCLAGSARDPWRLARPLDGSFIQPWRDDLLLSNTQWAERVADARRLGCPDLILQWTRHGTDYALDGDLIARLLDFVLAAGCRLRVGLPYDPDYWAVVEGRSGRSRDAFLADAAEASRRFMQAAPFVSHPAFSGWYLPYELDQASWARPEDVAALVAFLQAVRQAGGAVPMAVSCFHSRNDPRRSLLDLWRDLPADLGLRPLVQDGVGVYGISNYRLLAPLFAYLRARGLPFDVVVEVFAQKPTDHLQPGAFAADAAPFARLSAQLELAAASGAEHLIAFALHPYLAGPATGARQLLAAYEHARALNR